MPEPIGGIKAIQEKITYPEIAKRAGVEGKVYILAFVDENGNVTKANVLKGIGAGCDEAARDAVLGTKFKPGKQRGTPVKVQVSIPVVFKLN
jgi:periplasmic protein TonB